MSAQKTITVANAGTCSPYELRQELLRRGAFDLEEDKVNFRSLLQRLMVELVKDDELESQRRLAAMEEAAAAKREEAKRDRERKKQEALERSKARLTDPSYLGDRKLANEELPKAVKSISDVHVAEAGHADGQGQDEDEDEDEGADRDPFRTYKPKGRNKIFVR